MKQIDKLKLALKETILKHANSVADIITMNTVTLNEQMDKSKAHGFAVVKNYREGEEYSIIPFRVSKPEEYEKLTEYRVADTIAQIFKLGYDVQSVEFKIGDRRAQPFLTQTYFLTIRADGDPTAAKAMEYTNSFQW